MEQLLVVTAACYVLFGLIVTRSILKDDALYMRQKVMQIALVWLVPFFGGLLVLTMQGNSYSRAEMRRFVPFPFYLLGHRFRRSDDDGYFDSKLFSDSGSDGAHDGD